jgi:hypothetical protein
MRIILNLIHAAKIIILFFDNTRAFIFIFENKKLRHIILLIFNESTASVSKTK